MNETEHYTFGKSRVPPWAGDAMRDISYSNDGKLIRASILTATGEKAVKLGDVLMRINGTVVLVSKNDAKKYGIVD